MIKSYKVFLLLIVFSILIIFIFNHLPVNYKYGSEIKNGNIYIENLKKYQKKNNFLPKEDDWKSLEVLSPGKPFNESNPQYDKIGKNDFILTYVKSFDPPYLFYDSRNKIWKFDFPPIKDLTQNEN